jgi:hypothetical protein
MGNRHRISWTTKDEDGVKSEVRVDVTKGGVKWQFKGALDERWDGGRAPTTAEWDALEDILARRAQRGRALGMLEAARRARKQDGG